MALRAPAARREPLVGDSTFDPLSRSALSGVRAPRILRSIQEATMKRFLVLYESSVPAMEQMNAPPEQMKAGFELWMKWMQKAGGAIVDGGAPLATPFTVKGGAPGSAGKVTGYSIVQAGSRAEVERLFEGHPHFHAPGASIEVLEVIPMPASPGAK